MANEPKIVWHEHYFSPNCKDEANGRIDAIENDNGEIYVLDVGRNKVLTAYCVDRKNACAVAKLFADHWSPTRV